MKAKHRPHHSRWALARLRAAVVMRDVEGLSNSEAAEALDITVSALKSRLHRARVLLRAYLSEYLATAA